ETGECQRDTVLQRDVFKIGCAARPSRTSPVTGRILRRRPNRRLQPAHRLSSGKEAVPASSRSYWGFGGYLGSAPVFATLPTRPLPVAVTDVLHSLARLAWAH